MGKNQTPVVSSKEGESLYYASERAIKISQGIDNKVILKFQGFTMPVYPDSTNREMTYLLKLMIDAEKREKGV